MSSGPVGVIYLKGKQLPPPPAKLAEVDLPKGALRIRAAATTLPNPRRKKWIALEAKDLALLALESGPDRFQLRLVGPMIAGCVPMVSAATNHNRAKALLCRLYRSVPKGTPNIWNWAKRFFPIVLPDYLNQPTPMEIQNWLLSMPTCRRAPLQRAKELYDLTGWDQSYAQFHAFIKEELLPYFSKYGLDISILLEMVDRLINAPHDVTHIIAGPKIKPYIAWLKRQWHVNNYIFYGGVGPEKLQAWLERATARGGRLVFWSDYTLFDSSHNLETWDFVESLYSQHFSDPDFIKVLEAWRVPCGNIGDLKYKGRPMNASGRDDTAFANGLLNGFAMLLSVTAAWYEVRLEELTVGHIDRISSDLQLSVCGDDALGFLPWVGSDRAFKFVEDAKANLSSFGFKAKMFASDRFEDAVYLGHRPLPVDGKWYWTKTLGRCLYKMGWQVGVVRDPAANFMGIIEMHNVCSRHVPILSDICKAWAVEREGSKVTRPKLDPNRPWQNMGVCGPDHYSDDTIHALARAYSLGRSRIRSDLDFHDTFVTAQDVRSCIRHVVDVVKESGGRPCVLDHWLLAHMVAVDEQ